MTPSRPARTPRSHAPLAAQGRGGPEPFYVAGVMHITDVLPQFAGRGRPPLADKEATWMVPLRPLRSSSALPSR